MIVLTFKGHLTHHQLRVCRRCYRAPKTPEQKEDGIHLLGVGQAWNNNLQQVLSVYHLPDKANLTLASVAAFRFGALALRLHSDVRLDLGKVLGSG